MENFNEVQNDFENFNNLDYLQKLALIDKYQIECLITNINLQEKRIDKHYAISSKRYYNILSSENSNDFNLYSFSPQNEKEYLQLLSWLIKRDDLYFKPFETIKIEFLEEYKKANNKDQVFSDWHRDYDLKIKGDVLLSNNHFDNQVYRTFYDFGVKDFNYGNNTLEGLTELLFRIGDGIIYADKGTLNISKIVEYCCFYFQGFADANLFYFLQNEKEHLGKVIVPPAEQRGFDLGLTEEQLKALHQLLINDDFILCKEIDFINAFNGQQIVNKLEWIDRGERLTKYVTIQTLFQLLSSCNIELSDKNQVVLKEVKNALNHIFSNKWGNINSKFNDFKPLTTDRQKAIDLMVKNLKS